MRFPSRDCAGASLDTNGRGKERKTAELVKRDDDEEEEEEEEEDVDDAAAHLVRKDLVAAPDFFLELVH